MAGGLRMHLLDYVSEDSVFLLEITTTFESIIDTVARVIAPKVGCSTESITSAIKQREQASSTAIGLGCAVPHAALPQAVHTAVGAALLKKPLAIATPDDIAVDIVFILVGPSQEARIHLKLLSKIARILHDDETRAKIRSCQTVQEFIKILESGDAN